MNPKLKRLEEISDELFTLANEFGGNVTGTVAVEIHRANSVLHNAMRMLKTGVTEEDERNMFRQHLRSQTFNAGKTDAEIEQLVNLLCHTRTAAKRITGKA